MKQEEADRVFNLLRSAYPTNNFLKGNDQESLWFNMLNRFDFRDVFTAVKDYIASESKAPSVSDIIIRTENSGRARRNAERSRFSSYNGQHLVQCKKCNDDGYFLHRSPAGIEYVTFCDCQISKYKFPWWHMTKQQQHDWVISEQRAGRKPVNPYHESVKNYDEFEDWYMNTVR